MVASRTRFRDEPNARDIVAHDDDLRFKCDDIKDYCDLTCVGTMAPHGVAWSHVSKEQLATIG
jgi:hypothetical protein